MIKIFIYAVDIILIALLARYAYLDINYNHSIISDQIKSDIIEAYHALN